MTEYKFHDAAGIGRDVDEDVVLAKVKAGDTSLSDDEIDFIHGCIFYYHTNTQADIVKYVIDSQVYVDIMRERWGHGPSSRYSVAIPISVLERKQIILIPRDLCAEFGDNDWSDMTYLPDIIEKHLAKHLWKKEQ